MTISIIRDLSGATITHFCRNLMWSRTLGPRLIIHQSVNTTTGILTRLMTGWIRFIQCMVLLKDRFCINTAFRLKNGWVHPCFRLPLIPLPTGNCCTTTEHRLIISVDSTGATWIAFTKWISTLNSLLRLVVSLVAPTVLLESTETMRCTLCPGLGEQPFGSMT